METIIQIKINGELNNSNKNREGKIKFGHSSYTRVFDEKSHCWHKDLDMNKMFLKVSENHANDILKCRGHLFLNEVFDLLGLSRTEKGVLVGWVYKEDNTIGDNYVEFDVMILDDGSMLVDFNVDGCILEYL